VRLYVLVEGQTEQEFVDKVLGPHLHAHSVWVHSLIVETSRDAQGVKRRGGGRWKQWGRDLRRVAMQQNGPDVRLSTMFDLYGLPDDYPGLAEHSSVMDTVRRAELLEACMAAEVDDHRLVPYLQRHEFEALVLASLDPLERILAEEDRIGLKSLATVVAASSPENVNDGPTTAPSKRLKQAIPSYRKTLHGPLAVEATGLETLRKACPRFGAWVSKLEALGASQ